MRPARSHLCLRLVFTVAVVSLLGRAHAADPVEDLHQILFGGHAVQNKEQMAAYQKKLEEYAKAIQRPGDLRRALMLREWSAAFNVEQPGIPPDEEIPLGKAYQKVRAGLVERLQDVLRNSLRSRDSARRLAAITFLAAMADDESQKEINGVAVVGPGAPSRFTFTSSMAGDLLNVVSKDKEPRVRAAAAETFAAINPGSDQTLETLRKLLAPERDVLERRAAAKGLKRMLVILTNPQPVAPIVDGHGLVSAAGLGLSDKNDKTVRLLCLETIQQALQLKDPRVEVFRPLATAVNKQTPAVIALLDDADLKVCIAAHQVLEGIAGERRDQRRAAVNARLAEAEKLLDGILEALPKLKQNLAKEKELRVRLAALYVLETLGESAEKAVDEVALASKDKNGFVRWGAVRVLNNMAPRQDDKAVPALAERLTDGNKTVRLAAVQALGRYGPQAKPAAKPLSEAIGDSEAHVRLAAINALAAIGPDAHPSAGAVVKALVKALADEKQKPEVRTAAANALRGFGPLPAEATKALTRALEALDRSVRQAASETLLDKE